MDLLKPEVLTVRSRKTPQILRLCSNEQIVIQVLGISFYFMLNVRVSDGKYLSPFDSSQRLVSSSCVCVCVHSEALSVPHVTLSWSDKSNVMSFLYRLQLSTLCHGLAPLGDLLSF